LYSGENRRRVCLVITSLQIGRYFTNRSGIREQRHFEDGALIATHPMLDGRGRRRVAPGHRKFRVVVANATITADATPIPARAGERVARRSLAVYAAVGRHLAGKGERA
jgi:hypothetical protein